MGNALLLERVAGEGAGRDGASTLMIPKRDGTRHEQEIVVSA